MRRLQNFPGMTNWSELHNNNYYERIYAGAANKQKRLPVHVVMLEVAKSNSYYIVHEEGQINN